MNYFNLYRVVIFCLVALAAIKFWSSDSRLENWGKPVVGDQSSFWKLGEKEPTVKDLVNKLMMPPDTSDNDLSLADSSERYEVKIVAPLVPLRIVHLDLKGAAPKVKYLEQIFPLFSTLGADGVLLEYEDMFPYEGDLKILRSPHAYSVEDIKQIKNMAKLNKLELIPLVQVFGHLEFVLKHAQYHHLREVKEFPNSLNPRHPESVALVQKMVRQVMDAHPEAQWFHMGTDEVDYLGQGSKDNADVGKLFLNHVVKLARFISKTKPGLKVIMWDEMLRKIDPATIRESGLQNVSIPAISKYARNIETAWVDNLIARYQMAGFKGVWFSSAFKGAAGIDQQWTLLNQYLQNHLAWAGVMKSMFKYPSITLQGILLTGWQRYEHYTVLCELLPVAIPSLAMCLQSLKHVNGGKQILHIWREICTFTNSTANVHINRLMWMENTPQLHTRPWHGSFDMKAKAKVKHVLGCEVQLEKNLCEGGGAFPGDQIYKKVLHIHTNLKKEVDALMDNSQLKGGFSHYHRRHNFGNPINIGFFQNELDKLLQKWEAYTHDFHIEMETVYFTDTVEEWIEENVNPHLDQLRELWRDTERIVKLKGQPKEI